MAVTSASSGTRCIHDDTQKQQQHLNDNYDHDLDELKLAAAEVLALSHHSSTAKHRQEEVHGHQRQQRDHTQDIHAGYAAYTTMTADGNGNGNGSTSELQPSSPSSTKQATAAGNTGNSNGKRRIKASSTSEAAGMDSSDNPKAKRKKVSKACIFCKRSHMTCTENRPCERCIKRDIAHLCQDGPISGPTAAAASKAGSGGGGAQSTGSASEEASNEPLPSKPKSKNSSQSRSKSNDTSPPLQHPPSASGAAPASLSSLDDFPAATSAFAAPSFQQHHHQQQQQQQQSEGNSNRRTSSSSQLGINTTLPTPTSSTSLLFGGTNVLDESQPVSAQTTGSSTRPQHQNGRTTSHTGSHQSHSQSPAFGQQQNSLSLDSGKGNQQQQQIARHQSVNNSGQSSSTNQQQQQQQQSQQASSNNGGGGEQQQAQRSWNPFDILSQAYDFQYPSNNQNYANNSLASLRLFATTADAQFGKPSNTSGNGNGTGGGAAGSGSGSAGFGGLGGLAGMGLLNGATNNGALGSGGSENGTNSDIDSNALDEFLKSLDEMYLNPSPDVPQQTPSTSTSALTGAAASQTMPTSQSDSDKSTSQPHALSNSTTAAQLASRLDTQVTNSTAPSRSLSPVLGAGHVAPSTSTERFLLTAADQKEGTRDERLNRVIRAKYDAGLLRPFNYIKGYERLNTWMERKWSSSGKHRTLRIISEFRPHFRNIAQSLTDMDLIFIEEAFERLLLDYDRVFSTMGIPACLWRRTGEIFKGNREFAALVGIPYEQLRDGKLAIYELMTEDSAVNFWEKYGSIAFDPAQKAVLTSCVLVDQRKLKALQFSNSDSSVPTLKSLSSSSSTTGPSKDFVIPAASFSPNNIPEEARLTCTFSFTIRRDAYHIPNAIVGNFMPYDPKKVRL